MILDFNLEFLVEERYEIPLNEYWNLSKEQKDELTEILYDIVFIILKQESVNYKFYMESLDESIELLTFNEEYEKVEILLKLKDRINSSIFIINRYFT